MNDFMRTMLAAFPDATVEQDNDGQLVVYTNLMVRGDKVVTFDDEPKEYSLSDCVNWNTNVRGDCGGRVEANRNAQTGELVIMCETCWNREN